MNKKIWNNGSYLEELINLNIAFYIESNIAIFYKRNMNNFFVPGNSNYIGDYSGCDFIGLYNSKYITMEVKEVKGEVFHYKRISKTQKEELYLTSKLGGLSYILVYFNDYDRFFLSEYKTIMEIKKIIINDINSKYYEIVLKNNVFLDFIKGIEYFINL